MRTIVNGSIRALHGASTHPAHAQANTQNASPGSRAATPSVACPSLPGTGLKPDRSPAPKSGDITRQLRSGARRGREKRKAAAYFQSNERPSGESRLRRRGGFFATCLGSLAAPLRIAVSGAVTFAALQIVAGAALLLLPLYAPWRFTSRRRSRASLGSSDARGHGDRLARGRKAWTGRGQAAGHRRLSRWQDRRLYILHPGCRRCARLFRHSIRCDRGRGSHRPHQRRQSHLSARAACLSGRDPAASA